MHSLDSKISKLPINNDSINIIIAGDSRGERQLIPHIFKLNTGYNSINIAVTAGDIISTIPALQTYSDLNIYVISASSWQINDGAIDPGYLSLKCFRELTLFEKFQIYHENLNELVRIEMRFIKQSILFLFRNYKDDYEKYHYDDTIIKNFGFLGIEDTLEIDSIKLNSLLGSHAWYKAINPNGARWRIFTEELNKFNERNSLIVIFQPPVSPIWKGKTENTFIGSFEKNYSKKLDSLCDQYENIVFYDFYTNDIDSLENNVFYDYQHLNRNGAAIFSRSLSSIISKEIEARTYNTRLSH